MAATAPPALAGRSGRGKRRTFTYDDSIDPAILDPFEEANPGVEVQTATFNSNAQAAAKIKGGFGTDVIEVCLDESSPLVDNGLLAPIDTEQDHRVGQHGASHAKRARCHRGWQHLADTTVGRSTRTHLRRRRVRRAA